MSNHEGFRGPDFIEVKSSRSNRGEAAPPEVQRERGKIVKNAALNATPEKRKASDAEKTKAKNKLKRFAKDALIVVLGTAALIGAASVMEHPEKNALSKDEWTSKVTSELAGCHDVNMQYDTINGSYFEMVKEDAKGDSYYYSFNDTDTDGQPESGSVSGEHGAAEFKSQDGIPIRAAINQLDNKLGN